MKKKSILMLLCLSVVALVRVAAQTPSQPPITLDGYVFEENNRGFLREAYITVMDFSGVVIGMDTTDADGHFSIDAPWGRDYVVLTTKKIFQTRRDTVTSSTSKGGEKVFVKVQMERQPGYLFEVTLAEKRYSYGAPTDAILGSRVEIYNNTKKTTCLVIDSTTTPGFSYTFEQGNHYTILVRKNGYFNKRMEAHVNIDGCILCFEGVGTVTPGVVDNLSVAKANKMGTLIANVELDKIDTNRIVTVNNIYYDYNAANLRRESQSELDKLASLLKINPHLKIELSSHTDSRGSSEYNKTLSQARAQAAVDYLIGKAKLQTEYVKAKGYGEEQLVNACRDGVACNEKEHEQNRRTELRIVGIGPDPLAPLSLAEIIHAEELEKFINSGDAFGQVYRAPDATTTAPTTEPTTPPVSPTPDDATPKGTTLKVEQAPISAPDSAKKMDNSMVKKEIKVVTYPTAPPKTEKKEKELPKDKNKKTPNAPKVEPKVEKKAEPKVETKPTTPAPKPIGKEIKLENPNGATEIKVETVTQIDIGSPAPPPVKMDKIEEGTVKNMPENAVLRVDVSAIPPDAAGYKIELFTSATELKAESPMVRGVAEKVSSDIYVEKMPNGFSYLVGNFQTWGETERFLNSVQKDYPKAKIVDFFKGKRVQ